MIIYKKASELWAYLQQQKSLQQTIGFVPTMGALHAGHLSLIKLSAQQNAITVCSIFVNPTQFNNPDDLKHYPVTIEKDIEQLIKAGCQVLFLPTVAEIYPANYKPIYYNIGKLESMLEGQYRPGHFQGVCQVMDRLLHMVDPDNLYLGQKDYQQCMVIQKLITLINKQDTILLTIAPTQREASGLAMSSRNMRLSEAELQKASTIFQSLTYIKEQLFKNPLSVLQTQATHQLQQQGFMVDYVTIADGHTLESAEDTNGKRVALVAATLGNIRLIDNLILN